MLAALSDGDSTPRAPYGPGQDGQQPSFYGDDTSSDEEESGNVWRASLTVHTQPRDGSSSDHELVVPRSLSQPVRAGSHASGASNGSLRHWTSSFVTRFRTGPAACLVPRMRRGRGGRGEGRSAAAWDNMLGLPTDIPHVVEPTTSVHLNEFTRRRPPPGMARARTRTMTFEADDGGDEGREGGFGGASCAVCLEGFKSGEDLRVYPCEHQYHVACIEPWLALSSQCPVCRRDARRAPE